ncbi:MAG: adenylyltransferase/cytidyltransferase family protein [Acidobacteriota bacterium]
MKIKSDMAGKYKGLDVLAEIIEQAKKDGKKIALANGGFDLLHIGHVRYLRDSKNAADILVVAINSDRSLKNLKGDHRAEINEEGRAGIVGSLECVDYVTVFDEERVDKVLLTLKPDFHCKGSDYTPDTVPERDIVKSYGGRILITGGRKIKSSSDIIKDISIKKEIKK